MKNNVLEILEDQSDEYVSGEYIARTLNMTRANVWKEVSKLRKLGFIIESKPNHGYRLSKQSDVLSSLLLKKYIKENVPDYIESLLETTSTNDILSQLIMRKNFNTALVVSEYQSQGRGRMGRNFYSPSKNGIYMSMLFRPNMSLLDTQLITIASAVAIRQVLFEDYNIKTDIKWLNDLYIGPKKVGGILTEGEIELESLRYKHLIVGIGLNISNDGFIPQDLEGIYGSIFKEERVDRNRLIARIYDRIHQLTNSLPYSKKSLIEEYKKYSNVLGKFVTIPSRNNNVYKAIDIDENGYLIVEDDQKSIHILNSGEVSIKVDSNVY